MKKLPPELLLLLGAALIVMMLGGSTTEPGPIPAPPVSPPAIPVIKNPRPSYLPYESLVQQLQQWNSEAKDFTEIGTYGQTTKGKQLTYLRIVNRLAPAKKKVLITGCIHGNEPLSTSTVMWYAGVMLSTYGKDAQVTNLLNTRDIYFVPVVSPDSYPNSRHVDGVDPNRDFPGPYDWNHKSVKPVDAIAKLMIQERFNAAISGHTFGRIYLTPYGDKNQMSPNESDYQRIVGQMGQKSGYRVDRACNLYGKTIQGSDVDFYYRHGAFAIVMEFGTHQNIPSDNDIQVEFDKTYQSVLLFIREAPLVNVQKER